MDNQVEKTILCCIEASFYNNPVFDGLIREEIQFLLNQLNFENGEIGDAISSLVSTGRINRVQEGYYRIETDQYYHYWFSYRPEHELVKPELLDFIIHYFKKMIKKHGKLKAKVDFSVLVSEIMQEGFIKKETQLALKRLIYGKLLSDNEGIISLSPQYTHNMSYSELMAQHHSSTPRPILDKVLPLVEDIINKRQDGRSISIDPLEEFENYLDYLNYKNFSIWYHATQTEWKSINYRIMPKSFLVLSASICESILSLIVKYAKDNSLSMLKKLDENPKNWKFHNLIESACTGQNPLIDNDRLKISLINLNEDRKSIHAGYLINRYNYQTIPNINLEKAEIAKETVLNFTRRCVEWLRANSL